MWDGDEGLVEGGLGRGEAWGGGEVVEKMEGRGWGRREDKGG